MGAGPPFIAAQSDHGCPTLRAFRRVGTPTPAATWYAALFSVSDRSHCNSTLCCSLNRTVPGRDEMQITSAVSPMQPTRYGMSVGVAVAQNL
jgi:hypothetical protein